MSKTATSTVKAPNLPAMKRADRIRAQRELEYNRRDLRDMALVSGLGVALIYTSLWLVYVLFGG